METAFSSPLVDHVTNQPTSKQFLLHEHVEGICLKKGRPICTCVPGWHVKRHVPDQCNLPCAWHGADVTTNALQLGNLVLSAWPQDDGMSPRGEMYQCGAGYLPRPFAPHVGMSLRASVTSRELVLLKGWGLVFVKGQSYIRLYIKGLSR